MDDERLVRDIERLAGAAVEASRAHPGAGRSRSGRPLLIAGLAALIVLGGVILVGVRGERADDIATEPGALGTAPTASTTPSAISTRPAPSTTPGTTSSLAYPSRRPGTEIFRHASVDGHALLVGRMVTSPDDCTSGDVDQDGFCRFLQPGTHFVLDSIIDGDYVGAGGGGLPAEWDPSVSITSGGSGSGGRPGHERAYAVYATGPATALVQVDIRQPDGSVVTDSMAPAHGIVAFSALGYGDFVGPARAYDAGGTLLGTTLPPGVTWGVAPPSPGS